MPRPSVFHRNPAAGQRPTPTPSYDNWKHHDTGTTGTGLDSGEVEGIGAQGYWHRHLKRGRRVTGVLGRA